MRMNTSDYEYDDLRKKAAELEDRIKADEFVEREIRKVEEDFAYYTREEMSSISEMQERYIEDAELSSLLEEEYNLVKEEEQEYRQFVDEHRENMRKNKAEHEELLNEIRVIKEKDQWETE